MVSAHEYSQLVSTPTRYAFIDELDAIKRLAEGDPVALLKKRQENYFNSKMIICGSVTTKGESNMEKQFDATDKRICRVPCPHCAKFQALTFKDHIKWEYDSSGTLKRETVRYQCPYCKGNILDHHRHKMLSQCRWVATATSKNPASVGFWINRLYVPFTPWADIVQDFLDSKDDPALLQVHVNTSQAELWDNKLTLPSHSKLIEHSLDYELQIVPQTAARVWQAVDFHENGFEIMTIASSPGNVNTIIDYAVRMGGDANDINSELYENLTEEIHRRYKDAAGNVFRSSKSALDSGSFTETIYEYHLKYKRNTLCVKGDSRLGDNLVKLSKADRYSGRGIKDRVGIDLLLVNDSRIKYRIYYEFDKVQNKKGYERKIMISKRFPEFMFESLLGEKRVIEKTRDGIEFSRFIRVDGVRNEALDCLKYCLGLCYFYEARRLTIDDALAARKQPEPKPIQTYQATNNELKVTDIV